MLGKISGAARLLVLLAAIAGAFTTIPYLPVVLVVLGVIGGLDMGEDNRVRLVLGALLFTLTAKSFEVIPTVGVYLSSILGGLGLGYVGAATIVVLMGFMGRVKGDWVKQPA